MEVSQINVEVAFATLQKQVIISLCVAKNAKVMEVIKQSKIQDQFPQLNLSNLDSGIKVGIFGKKIDLQTYVLQEHDRIEIYRPLNKSPNQKRLERARSS